MLLQCAVGGGGRGPVAGHVAGHYCKLCSHCTFFIRLAAREGQRCRFAGRIVMVRIYGMPETLTEHYGPRVVRQERRMSFVFLNTINPEHPGSIRASPDLELIAEQQGRPMFATWGY
jgi:hypothetical protein